MKWWPWFRMYTNVVDNPKVRMLAEYMQARWLLVLAVAARHGGTLPELSQIAFSLRLSAEETQRTLNTLALAGLLDRSAEGLKPHDWEQWQAPSDRSTDRVKKHRELKRCETVSVTAGVTGRRDETLHETLHETPQRVASRVTPTVENVIDWQAFSLWAVYGMKRNRDMVLEAIEARAPGFLEAEMQHWQVELGKGNRCTFEGDFVPALLVYGLPLPNPETKPILRAADGDPRQDRMLDYLGRCTESPSLCEPWPDFETWREAAWAA